jgi:hypothetical protein
MLLCLHADEDRRLLEYCRRRGGAADSVKARHHDSIERLYSMSLARHLRARALGPEHNAEKCFRILGWQGRSEQKGCESWSVCLEMSSLRMFSHRFIKFSSSECEDEY